MTKTIKLEGNFTKEQLEEELLKFDSKIWEIVSDEKENIITLQNDAGYKTIIWDNTVCSFAQNITNLVLKMAQALGYLSTFDLITDKLSDAHNIFFNHQSKEINEYWSRTDLRGRIIDTKEHAKEIVSLIKSSLPLLRNIWRRGE